MDPVILTCAISGAVANRDQCPAIPYTPEEYAAEARRIVDEGGSMIHIHARRPNGTPSHEVEDFRAITEAIRAEVDDVVINYSTGAIGVPVEKRIAYLRELKPDVGALNMGSMNYAKYSRRRKDFVFKAVFENSFDTIIALLEAMNESGIRPEHECFDSGHLANLDPLLDMGLLKPPLQVSCVMGVIGGIRPTARNLAHMAEQVPPGQAPVGRDRHQPRAVDAGRGRAGARRQRARRAWRTTSTCPTGRWRARTATWWRRRARWPRTPAGASPPWPRRASCSVYERARRACASSTSRDCCPAGSARCCSPTSAPT